MLQESMSSTVNVSDVVDVVTCRGALFKDSSICTFFWSCVCILADAIVGHLYCDQLSGPVGTILEARFFGNAVTLC